MGMTLRHTVVCTLVSIALVGCTTTTPAPIQVASGVSASSSGQNSTQMSGTSGGTTTGNGWTPIPTPPSSIAAGSANSSDNSYSSSPAGSNNATMVSASSNGGVGLTGSAVPNRNYSSIPKGSFSGDNYTVERGDTLFYIAWISGNDFRTLAARNNISEPYHLTVGQVLDVSNGNGLAGSTNASTSQNNLEAQGSQSNQNVGKMLPPTGASAGSTTVANTTATSSATSTPTSSVGSGSAKIVWRWPADGKIIDSFSSAEGGNKGIDIAGTRGQSVVSAANGRVVYAGNALRGYGNLIIIKHNDDYLSAYAHNDTMLVSEQQDVKAGQKIATMGSTGASSVRLHFEVRYKGNSVNPLQYLPQR